LCQVGKQGGRPPDIILGQSTHIDAFATSAPKTCTALVFNYAGRKVDARVPLPRLSLMRVRFDMLGGPDGSLMGIVQQRMMNFESSLPSIFGLLLHFAQHYIYT